MPYTRKTLVTYFGIFRQIMNFAFRLDFIKVDLMKKVELSVPPITFDDMEKESKKLFSYDRLLQNSRSFANFGKRAGFDRKISPHALRHSPITHLVESGANQVAIMERVGHSGPTITTKIYTHTTDNMRSRLVDLIDENQKKFWAKLSEK